MQYNEKIEERNNEFSKLKLTTGNIGVPRFPPPRRPPACAHPLVSMARASTAPNGRVVGAVQVLNVSKKKLANLTSDSTRLRKAMEERDEQLHKARCCRRVVKSP